MEELSKAILRDPLKDFEDRNLTAKGLPDSNPGVNQGVLGQITWFATSASPADFELALKDLEDGHMVGIGPMVLYKNHPGCSVFVIGVYSKREYAYLKVEGCNAAQKTQDKRSAPPTTQSIRISGSHFHQSPIWIGANVPNPHKRQSLTDRSSRKSARPYKT